MMQKNGNVYKSCKVDSTGNRESGYMIFWGIQIMYDFDLSGQIEYGRILSYCMLKLCGMQCLKIAVCRIGRFGHELYSS